MKHLIFLLMALVVTVDVQAQMSVTHPQTQPIQVKIVKSEYSRLGLAWNLPAGRFMYDEQDRMRIKLVDDGGIVYFSSNGKNEITGQRPSEQEFLQLMALAKNASNRCPLFIKINRENFEILEASSPCDPFE